MAISKYLPESTTETKGDHIDHPHRVNAGGKDDCYQQILK